MWSSWYTWKQYTNVYFFVLLLLLLLDSSVGICKLFIVATKTATFTLFCCHRQKMIFVTCTLCWQGMCELWFAHLIYAVLLWVQEKKKLTWSSFSCLWSVVCSVCLSLFLVFLPLHAYWVQASSGHSFCGTHCLGLWWWPQASIALKGDNVM